MILIITKKGGMIDLKAFMSICFTVLLTFSFIVFSHPQQKAVASEVYFTYYAKNDLVAYSERGHQYSKVGTFEFQDSFQVKKGSIRNGWAEIKWNSRKAYVESKSIVNRKPQATYFNYYPKEPISYYAGRGTNTKRLGSIAEDSVIKVRKGSVLNGWSEIQYKGNSYYVQHDKLSNKAPIYFTYYATMDFTLYNERHTGTPKVNIPVDAVVKVKKGSVKNGWSRIEYNGIRGYAPYVNISKNKNVYFTYYTTTNMPYYSSSSFTNKVGTLQSGVEVLVKKGSVVNNKVQIKVNGKSYFALYNQMDNITYSNIDLRIPANVTAAEINRYISAYEQKTSKKSVFRGQGQAFIDAGNQYGVNALFLAAIGIHESAYGTSNLAISKNNLFGLKAYDAAPYESALRFNSVADSIHYEAQYVKFNYIDPNGTYYGGAPTLAGMNNSYSTDAGWHTKIANHMKNIKAFDAEYYATKKPNTNRVGNPGYPAGSDYYPADTVAKVKNGAKLSLYQSPSTSGGKKATISEGESFNLLEKRNDFWVKVKYKNKLYWTNSLKYYEYTKTVTVTNLVRVETYNYGGGTTPLYQTANTSSEVIATVSNNQFVTLLQNPSGGFIQVKDSNGKIGWLDKKYAKFSLK